LRTTRLAACAALAIATSVLPVFTQTHGPATPATGNRAIAPPGPLGPLSPRTGLLLRDEVVIRLIQQSSGDRARDHVALLTQWDRSQVSDGYSHAAAWVSEQAKGLGLEDVQIERFPSDGTVEYFGNPTDALWRAHKGELWMTSPALVRLTTVDELPMSLARNSASADVEAELVDVGEGTRPQDYATDVKGRIVLSSGSLSSVVQRAVTERGALAVVSSWSVPEFDRLNRLPGDFPDQVGWNRIRQRPDGSWPPTFAFSITARRAEELRGLLRKGVVKVRGVVDTERVPGSLDVVSGTIRGATRPDDEIIITAHLDHYKPGANDNASGSASVLEIVRTLRTLIADGRLPPPARTLRFLWVPEYNGTWAWFATHLDDRVTRVANLNFDMLGENLLTTNAVFNVSYTPDSNPSWLNAVLESTLDFMNAQNDDRYPPAKEFQIISVTGSRNRLQGRMTPFTVGTDHELFNNLKIPGSGPGAWPDNFYHSSTDTLERVDPTQLHRVVFLGLAALTTAAYAGDDDAANIARLALLYGRRRIAASEFAAGQSVAAASREDFAARDRLASRLLRHVHARERAAVRSAGVFARADAPRAVIEELATSLQEDEGASLRAYERLSAASAADLGVVRAASTATGDERLAARLVPSRVRGQELVNFDAVSRMLTTRKAAGVDGVESAFDNLAVALRAHGESELRLMGLRDAAAYYADGRRTVLDIADAFAADYGPLPAGDLVAYFRAYERAGVMTIAELPVPPDRPR
jgi:hypothetical protein